MITLLENEDMIEKFVERLADERKIENGTILIAMKIKDGKSFFFDIETAAT